MADHGKKDDGRGKPKGGDGKKLDEEQIKELKSIPVVKEIFHDFNDFLKIDLSTALSAVDDEIHELGTSAGEAAGRKVKRDSFFRGWFMRRFSSVAINRLEQFGKTLGGWKESGVVKLADFLDSFRQAFFGGKDAADAVEKEVVTTERAKRFDEGDAKLADDGLDLILTAPPSGIASIREVNRDRASAWHDYKETIRHGPPKPEVPKEPSVPFSERLRQVDEEVDRILEPVVDQMEKGLAEFKANTARKEAQQKAERKAKPPARRGWILRLILGSRKTT